MQTNTQARVFTGAINLLKWVLSGFGLMFIADAKTKVRHLSFLLVQAVELSLHTVHVC
jgi:hypothetical protein